MLARVSQEEENSAFPLESATSVIDVESDTDLLPVWLDAREELKWLYERRRKKRGTYYTTLTEDQRKFAHKIDDAEIAVVEVEWLRDRLKKTCTHVLRPLTEAELADKWMSVGAHCEICGEGFDWRCKRSPDGVCHYYTDSDGDDDKRTVRLIDKTVVPYGEDEVRAYYKDGWAPEEIKELEAEQGPSLYEHDPHNETDDCCLFCGHPDERK
jgi:hypothetical protein